MALLKKRILTGDRPTGPLHLGHYVGTLENRVLLQDKYDAFFIIADYQVLTDHLKDAKQIKENIRQIVLDWLSVGMDPAKSTFFVQSMIPEIAELTMIFSFLVSMARLQRNPTVKEEAKAAHIAANEMSYGFFGYPVSQAADILIVRANLVPVGGDQAPHVEQTRELARKFNATFGKVFPEPEPLFGKIDRLPGIDGKKMSKSMNNAIYLSDSPDAVTKKVMKAYTDPTRIHADDPGHIEGNVVFAYLDAFHPEKKELNSLKDRYKKGKVGDVEIKKLLIDILLKFLKPIQNRRKKFEKNPKIIDTVLKAGNRRARKEAQETMKLVRKAASLDYPY